MALARNSSEKEEKETITSGKRLVPEWTFNIGEEVVNLTVDQNNDYILVLTLHSVVCVKHNGIINFFKKLEYSPACMYTSTCK